MCAFRSGLQISKDILSQGNYWSCIIIYLPTCYSRRVTKKCRKIENQLARVVIRERYPRKRCVRVTNSQISTIQINLSLDPNSHSPESIISFTLWMDRAHMSINIPTLPKNLHTNPTNMGTAYHALHMITPHRFLNRHLAFRTIFYIICPLPCHELCTARLCDSLVLSAREAIMGDYWARHEAHVITRPVAEVR